MKIADGVDHYAAIYSCLLSKLIDAVLQDLETSLQRSVTETTDDAFDKTVNRWQLVSATAFRVCTSRAPCIKNLI